MYGLSKVTKLGPPGILVGRLPVLYCSFISIGFIESMNLSVSPDLFSLKELPAKASSLGVSEVQETDVSLPVDTRKNVAVSPQVTNTGGQVMANATLGSRYLGGIDYNRMNTAQKADYVDKVFKV